jgi:putative NADPH-quinone reductase
VAGQPGLKPDFGNPCFGSMPALLKGFLEQVFRPGRKLLAGKSARVIATRGAAHRRARTMSRRGELGSWGELPENA